MEEEIPYKFWREYESSDMIEREKKLDNIVKRIDKMFNIKDEKMRKHILRLALMGYFNDILEYKNLRK